jgi:cellulose synthase/poly-beta-1,6-N-acetylglucosamine synthase-like glycosyltransferase
MSSRPRNQTRKRRLRGGTMPEALPQPASVAFVPCYNEGRNPIEVASVLASVPGLTVVFLDDGSDAVSRQVLDGLAEQPGVSVRTNPQRVGKAASVSNAMKMLPEGTAKVIFADCDVRLSIAAVEAVLEELNRTDLVLANAKAIQQPRTLFERGAIFSANRHDRLRETRINRYPARCTNGRLLGMGRSLAEAIARTDVPRHTEDAHFMLVCLSEGYRFSYRRDAVLHYRAPDSLRDYLRQTNRFSEGRALLRERWPEEMLRKHYDLEAGDVVRSTLAQAIRDPLGAAVFVLMIGAKGLQPNRSRSQGAAWAVAGSTKALR